MFGLMRQNNPSTNRNYITTRPERLDYRTSGVLSHSKNVILSNGHIAFQVHHRRGTCMTDICDGNGALLFQIRFEPHWISQSTYYAYSPFGVHVGLGSNALWQMNRKSDSATSTGSIITCAHGTIAGGIDFLEYEQRFRGRLRGELTRGGQIVARVARTGMFSTNYVINISSGVDLALVIRIVAAVDDKIRNESSAT